MRRKVTISTVIRLPSNEKIAPNYLLSLRHAAQLNWHARSPYSNSQSHRAQALSPLDEGRLPH